MFERRKHDLTKPRLRLIAFIGVIVPRRLRADWRREWEAELRYREELLTQWDNLNWKTKLALLWHSLGAFMDALWLQPRRLEDEMFQDLRYGVRMLLKSPAFTFAAIVSLAIGIGANTAVFSVVNAVLWRPLPYAAAERLVVVAGGRSYARWFTAPDFVELSKRNRTLDHLSASVSREFASLAAARRTKCEGSGFPASPWPCSASRHSPVARSPPRSFNLVTSRSC